MHARLTALTQARTTARTAVRVAPRRMRMRATVDAEADRLGGVYPLAHGVLALTRAAREVALARAAGEVAEPGPDSQELCEHELERLRQALCALASAARPLSSAAVAQVRSQLLGLQARPVAHVTPAGAIVAAAIRRVADDLGRLLPEARAPADRLAG